MLVIQASDLPDSVHGGFIAYLATQCVAGICWITDHATLIEDFDRLPEQAHLRIVRVNLKKLCHIEFCAAMREIYRNIEVS